VPSPRVGQTGPLVSVAPLEAAPLRLAEPCAPATAGKPEQQAVAGPLPAPAQAPGAARPVWAAAAAVAAAVAVAVAVAVVAPPAEVLVPGPEVVAERPPWAARAPVEVRAREDAAQKREGRRPGNSAMRAAARTVELSWAPPARRSPPRRQPSLASRPWCLRPS
jgi:hypothetical protein